jgi:hypothetical protein
VDERVFLPYGVAGRPPPVDVRVVRVRDRYGLEHAHSATLELDLCSVGVVDGDLWGFGSGPGAAVHRVVRIVGDGVVVHERPEIARHAGNRVARYELREVERVRAQVPERAGAGDRLGVAPTPRGRGVDQLVRETVEGVHLLDDVPTVGRVAVEPQSSAAADDAASSRPRSTSRSTTGTSGTDIPGRASALAWGL